MGLELMAIVCSTSSKKIAAMFYATLSPWDLCRNK